MIETIIDILPYIGIAGYTVGKGNQFWTPGAFESKYSPFEDKGTDITVRNPYSGMQNDVDTSNIDFGDKNQVMNIQKALNASGAVDSEGNPLAVDGMFGPNTEFAYRNYINQKRTSEGLDPFGYGTNTPTNVNEENMNMDNPDNIPPFLPQNINAYSANSGYNDSLMDNMINNQPVQGPENYQIDPNQEYSLNFGVNNQGNELNVNVPPARRRPVRGLFSMLGNIFK